jgi:beta-glucanase (GH16 family)
MLHMTAQSGITFKSITLQPYLRINSCQKLSWMKCMKQNRICTCTHALTWPAPSVWGGRYEGRYGPPLAGVWAALWMKTEKDDTDVIMRALAQQHRKTTCPSQTDKSSESRHSSWQQWPPPSLPETHTVPFHRSYLFLSLSVCSALSLYTS